jgi:transcriptional regulator with XRE-family HTH domain
VAHGRSFFRLSFRGNCRLQPIGRPKPTAHNDSVSSPIALRFGQRIRRLRQKRGLSQVEMAHRFGIDRGHISDLERGKKSVCLPMLDVLSKIRDQRFRIDAWSVIWADKSRSDPPKMQWKQMAPVWPVSPAPDCWNRLGCGTLPLPLNVPSQLIFRFMFILWNSI